MIEAIGFSADGMTPRTFTVRPGEQGEIACPNSDQAARFALALAGAADFAGALFVCGVDMRARPLAARAHLGLALKNPPGDPRMRLDRNLRFIAALREIPRADRAKMVREALRRAGADGRARVGEADHAGLAQALVSDPEVLVVMSADRPDPALADGRALVWLSWPAGEEGA